MKKIVSFFVLLLILSLFIGAMNVQATSVDELISDMNGASTLNAGDKSSGIATTINNVIGLLQIAGTGIALVVITMLGIKYMIASPSEKADTKKQILPILIGCVLVFGAVNIVAAITDLAAVVESEA